MEKQDKLDDIRSRTHIDDIDSSARKELFNKFQQSGGKIVDLENQKALTSNKKYTQIKRDVKKNKTSTVDTLSKQENPFHQKSSDSIKTSTTKKSESNKDKSNTEKKESIIKLFFARISCWLANIFNFSGKRFSSKFIKITTKTVFVELSSLKVLLDPIFKETTAEGLKFRTEMIEQGFIEEYELAYYTYFLLQDSWLLELNKSMNSSVDSTEETFKDIFKQLYLFRLYYKKMQFATFRIVQSFHTSMSESKKNNVKKKIDAFFSLVWGEWFIYLDELINYFWIRSNTHNIKESLLSFLEINKDMFPDIGVLSRQWTSLYENELKSEIEGDDNQDLVQVFPSVEIEQGVDAILLNVNFAHYYNSFRDSKDMRSLLTHDDKLLYTYVLLDYFDKEYNKVWNMINFYVIPDRDLGRFDAKKEVKILINQLRQLYELFNDHLRFVRTNNHIDSQQVQLSEKKEKEISRSSFAIRKNAGEVFESFGYLLARIVNSKNTDQEIIGNWSESINPNGQELITVEEFMDTVYKYIVASVWLLKFSDLSGLSSKVETMTVLSNELLEEQDNH